MPPALKRKASTKSNYKTKKTKLDKQIKTNVRKTLLGLAETKSAVKNINVSTNANLVYAVAANYFISEGAGANQVVGEKIYLRNFYLRYYAEVSNNSTVTLNQPTLRIMLVKSVADYTTTSGVVGNTEIFRNDGQASAGNPATNSHVDMHKVKLLWDHTFSPRIDDGTSGLNQTTVINGDISVPVNKTEFFTADNSGRFRSGNYYWIVTQSRPGDLGLTSGVTFSLQWSVNFKDI